MIHEINYNELVIGKEYICKFSNMSNKEKIKKIEKIGIVIFVHTNIPEHTYQVYPYKMVKFYDNSENKTISNNIQCIILEPYTMCPITYEYFEDGDEIITIDDRFMFKKKELENWLEQKNTNPLTNMEIKTSDLKYYTVIILPSII